MDMLGHVRVSILHHAIVAKLASIQTILATACDEEVFMEQPPGYEEYCLKLYKSIYGLKQAGRKWYEIVCHTLADLGFKKCEADPVVFYIHSGKQILILAIHVDDCNVTGLSHALVQQLIQAQIKSKYALTDLEPINWLLSIKIT
jgi:Reverse transcriptase (RNA-dependent DNA polymerase)